MHYYLKKFTIEAFFHERERPEIANGGLSEFYQVDIGFTKRISEIAALAWIRWGLENDTFGIKVMKSGTNSATRAALASEH